MDPDQVEAFLQVGNQRVVDWRARGGGRRDLLEDTRRKAITSSSSSSSSRPDRQAGEMARDNMIWRPGNSTYRQALIVAVGVVIRYRKARRALKGKRTRIRARCNGLQRANVLGGDAQPRKALLGEFGFQDRQIDRQTMVTFHIYIDISISLPLSRVRPDL